MCYKCLACESKMASIFNSGQFSGLPTELPTISILESSGLPTELPTISVYGSSGEPYLHGKIPMCSPWAAHSALHWAAHFLKFGSSGLPTVLPTELPTVSIYGSSGQPNLHGKIPMGSPWAAHPVAHVQPMGSEVGSSPVFFFFRMGVHILRVWLIP